MGVPACCSRWALASWCVLGRGFRGRVRQRVTYMGPGAPAAAPRRRLGRGESRGQLPASGCGRRGARERRQRRRGGAVLLQRRQQVHRRGEERPRVHAPPGALRAAEHALQRARERHKVGVLAGQQAPQRRAGGAVAVLRGGGRRQPLQLLRGGEVKGRGTWSGAMRPGGPRVIREQPDARARQPQARPRRRPPPHNRVALTRMAAALSDASAPARRW